MKCRITGNDDRKFCLQRIPDRRHDGIIKFRCDSVRISIYCQVFLEKGAEDIRKISLLCQITVFGSLFYHLCAVCLFNLKRKTFILSMRVYGNKKYSNKEISDC